MRTGASTRPRRIARWLALAVILAGLASMALAAASQPATAQVTMGDLTVNDVNHTSESGVIDDITAQVAAEWNYSASDGPAQLRVTLDVAPAGGSYEPIATYTESDSLPASGTGSRTLAGSILSHSQLDSGTFTPPDGGSVNESVDLRLRFALLDAEGAVVESAVAETTVAIEVVDGSGLTATVEVGGEGDVFVFDGTATATSTGA